MLDLLKKPDKPLIAPSALASEFANMAADCKMALDAGGDLLHLDIMDGHFVPALTMGPDMVRSLRQHLPNTLLDCHLMVEHPGDFIDDFAQAGANHISFHLEVCYPFHPKGHDATALIEQIKAHGCTAGMVINPHTPAEPLEPWLDRLDMALVMSVVPGAGGQKFMPEVLPKTRWLRDRLPDTARVEMDGGLSPDTAGQAIESGCEVLVAGSAVFGSDKPAKRSRIINRLRIPEKQKNI